MLNRNLKKSQLSNLEAVFEAVKDFSKDAEVDFLCPPVDRETILLESGHQPNFLPHAGFWKKLFLLDLLRKKFEKQGKKAIALFGFADYNLSTSRLLTQNKLPALNKLGYEKVGFKIDNVWKRFDCIQKPEETEWKKEIEKIANHYKKYSTSQNTKLNLTELIKILEESYRYAKNFPDLNAFFISRVCNKLFNLGINFFRYSDLQRKRVFLEEWKNIILNIRKYNSIYNNTVNNLNIDIPLCDSDSLPFWYHCSCGAKVNLLLNERHGTGKCRLCSKDHVIDIYQLEEKFEDMSPNGVSRNVIFSEGMGTHIFISGSGGSLVYGKISEAISKELGFCLPCTVSWKSGDYYIGHAHAAALLELGRICGIAEDITHENIDKIIKDKKNRLAAMAAEAKEKGEKEEVKKYEGQYKNMGTSIAIIKAIFNTTPSFIDILVCQGFKKTLERWEHALMYAGEKIIVKDVVYGNEDVVDIYKKLEELSD